MISARPRRNEKPGRFKDGYYEWDQLEYDSGNDCGNGIYDESG